MRRFLIGVAAALALMAQAKPAPTHRQLLIVLDGLRPDYVTPAIMPNLYALGQRGVVFSNHHSVYPTVTRVNASSISTGAYPEIHGLMGNSVYFPQVDASRFLDTADRGNLLKINAAVFGRLLTAPTLAQDIQGAGKKVLVVSSGSAGSAFLLNYTVAGGAVLQSEFALPEQLYAEMTATLGPLPPEGRPNDARNRRAVDAFLRVGLPKVDPTITVMWLSDPDETAHTYGVGEPTTIEALKRVDAEIKRVLDGLTAASQIANYDIWVTSDHGFSTGTPAPGVAALLKPFERALPDGSPRIVAGNGPIYVRDHDRPTIAAIVAALQRTPGVGAIFTRSAIPGNLDGWVPGTLSFDAIRWSHERSADILYSADWTDAKNAFGFPGAAASGGVANHGSSSPYDVHNVLMAAGPDLKEKLVIRAPSGNVDFAPTLLRLIGAEVPSSMQGRVLEEAFRGGPDPAAAIDTNAYTVRNADGSYSLTGSFSAIETASGRFRYFNYTNVERKPAAR